MTGLPAHLQRYVVTQDYSRYTPVDHAVWRYILRQLRAYLSEHAHPSYLDGLKKTGISIDRIPKIEDISRRLEEFGWRAIPVSGFIPPAAFMELQAHGILPIASDMRTFEHLMYTPAPDIVHEAAGHAPILVEPRFAEYLKEYNQVARKAIISSEDLNMYEAIRVLSDLKEHPESTPEQIKAAESQLDAITKSMSHISEASRLGRMNWWTAEYGLIGSLENPRIFGAGLLSSVGEARNCLSSKVKKIPLTVDCVEYSYDITEQQPQLFVTPDFDHLSVVLEDLAKTMAFRTGGTPALDKALEAKTVNAVELDSGLQISGQLAKWIRAEDGSQATEQKIAYLQFQGPTQLALNGEELTGHGIRYHTEGFGTPIGFLKSHAGKPLARFSDGDLASIGLRLETRAKLEFESGVTVEGRLTGWLRSPQGSLLLLSFKDCKVTLGSQVLFQPEWGTFDMGVGATVVSVFGGPADRDAYGITSDFVASRVPEKRHSPEALRRFALYQAMRDLRESTKSESERAELAQSLLRRVESEAPQEWLLKLEALELAETMQKKPEWKDAVRRDLEALALKETHLRSSIEDGLKLSAIV